MNKNLTSRLEKIKAPLKTDFHAMNQLIEQKLKNQCTLTQEVCKYLIHSGGRRLRPTLMILTTKALDYEGHQHIPLATILEFLHTATLLHDDVIDHSHLRRNRETANAVWDNETCILMGDFLHALSFDMIVETQNIPIMRVFAQATNQVIHGEIRQLIWRKNLQIEEAEYTHIIESKTARLFSAATQVGALIATTQSETIHAMYQYGLEFGIAYQLMDDILDYVGCTNHMGKNIGDDLAQGKLTLPLITALRRGTQAQRAEIHKAIEHTDASDFQVIKDIIQQTGALQYTHNQAKHHAKKAQKALTHIQESTAQAALHEALTFVVEDQLPVGTI